MKRKFKKHQLRKEFLKRIQKWSLESTIHGLSNLVRAETVWRRLFWIVSLVVCVCLCALLVGLMIKDYFDYDVIGKSRTLPLDDDDFFPIVLVCNENPFLSPASQLFLTRYFRQHYSLDNVSSYEQVVDSLGGIDAASRAFSRILYDMNSPHSDQSFGYAPQDIFFEMVFNDLAVDLNDLESFFDPTHGPCFRFNSGRNARGASIPRKRISSPHIQLSMTVLVGVSYEVREYIYEPPRRGILIEVKDPDGYPFMSKPFMVAPGQFSQIELSKYASRVLPRPYSGCLDEASYSSSTSGGEIASSLTEMGISYTHEYCRELLMQMDTVQALGCHDLRLIRTRNHTLPSCTQNDLLIDHKNQQIYSADEIFEYCPLACDYVTYVMDMTKQEFPTLGYFKQSVRKKPEYFERVFVDRHVTYEMFRDSMTHVNVFFHETSVTELSEKPKLDAVGLVSNLGGIIGVFLGVSVLTLVEFVELVGFFVWIWIKTNSPKE